MEPDSDTSGRKGPHPPLRFRTREVVGASLWVTIVQFFVMMVVVQAAWESPYSVVRNAISDLGVVGCGTSASRDICSPWHVAANISWVLTGLSMALGAILLWTLIARDPIGRAGAAFLVLSGLGEVMVGLKPADVSSVHVPAATVAILGGLLGITCVGVSLVSRGTLRGVGRAGIVLGAIGFAGSALLTFLPDRLFGLIERVAAYPILIWLPLAGIAIFRHRVARE